MSISFSRQSQRRQPEHQNGVRSENTVILLILLAFFTMGVVSGCVLWNKTFTVEDSGSLCAAFTAHSDWSEARAAVVSRTGAIGLFGALLVLSSFFTFGWLVAPVVIFIFGLGFGAGLCSLMDGQAIISALPSLAAFVLPAAISVPLLVLLARDCVRAAGSIAFSRGILSNEERPFLRLFAHLPLYLIAAIVYAAVQTALCQLFV